MIDKPLNWTSFDVVKKIRYDEDKIFYGIKKIKVGHAGTLDPLATGVLEGLVNFTKEISKFQSQTKTYTGTFLLGSTTPSYDLETESDSSYPVEHITKELIIETTDYFTGKINQKPPIFSAIKKDGKRLYESARLGEKVKIDDREIEIFDFNILKIDITPLILK